MKEFAEQFYKSKQWKSCRKNYISSVGGLCEDCLAKGIYRSGEIVHHIIYLSPENINNPSITLDWSNLRLVCRECHAREHRHEARRRYEVDDDGRVTLAGL